MDVITSFKKAERTIQETIPGKITERGTLKHTSVHMKKVTFCLTTLVSFRDEVTGCAGERSAAAGIYLTSAAVLAQSSIPWYSFPSWDVPV